MLKSYFLQFGLFGTRDGECLNSVGETKETVNNRSTGASAAASDIEGEGQEVKLNPLEV